LQEHLLTQDTLPAGCGYCAEVESKNQLSVRQLRNKYFKDTIQPRTQIQYLDIFPSNVCNLNCIMCLPKFSSSIAAEQKILGNVTEIYNFDETDFVIDTINKINDLKSISIAGGEFFYAKHSLKILKAIQQSNITDVKITTNATVCDDRHIAILKTFKNLELRFSIDGTRSTYEFIRYPADWSLVQSNILKFQQQLPDAHLETINVFQPLNVFDQFNWITWANTHNLETHWQVVQGEMGWQALTQTEKEIAIDFLMVNYKSFELSSKQKLTILNYARNGIPKYEFNPEYRNQFVKKIIQLSNHRKLPVQMVAAPFENWPDLQQLIISQLI
jgi:sulfatase maturation enzyme AslB (radical SAM superfamily)